MAIFEKILIHGFQTNTGKPAGLKERLSMRKHCGPYQWTPSKPGTGRGFYQSSKGLAMGDSTIDLRLVEARELLPSWSRLRHVNGYWCDEHQDTTMLPIVARLPRGRGFLVGWTMGEGMCASIGADVYQDSEEAARAAYDDAERAAEREREYQAKQEAEIDSDDDDDDSDIEG